MLACIYLGIEHVLIIVHHDICKCQHVAGQKVGAPALLTPIFSHVLQCVPAYQFQLLLPWAFQAPACQAWHLMQPFFVRKEFCCLCMSPAAPRQLEQTRPGVYDNLHSSIHDAFSTDGFQALIELAGLDVRVVGLGLSHPGGCQLPTLRVTAFP